MTEEQQRREIYDQPCAFKLVYQPEHGINAHVIVRGPDGWHMFYNNCLVPDLVKKHAVSEDLLTWTEQAPIFDNGPDGAADHAQVGDCTVIEHEGRWHMLYQARPTRTASRRICLAVSDDLRSWQKVYDGREPVFTPDPAWSGWHEEAGARYCTSPWVIRHDDQFVLYYCCYDASGDDNDNIAVATSRNLVDWEDHGPIITVRNLHDPLIGPGGFEVPKIVKRDGKLHLFVLAFHGWVVATGDDPFHFGPFTAMGPWHGSNVFEVDDGWCISHSQVTVGKAGVRGSRRPPWRGLYLAGLIWADDHPFVTDLQDVLDGWPDERSR